MRVRKVGERPGGGGRLSPPPASPTLLRPALELALVVARAGEKATPPQPAPRGLSRFLRFTRLPAAALDAVRRELDTNDDFRRRVAEAASEDRVGRSGWLFLTRPEGWEAALADLLAEADPAGPADPAAPDATGDRAVARRLRAAEEARLRAETGREKAERSTAAEREKTARLSAELAEERRRRRQAEKDADEVGRRLTSAEGEIRAAARQAAEQAKRTERAEARLAELESSGRIDPAEVGEALGRLRAASSELANAVEAVGRAVAAGAARRPRRAGGADARRAGGAEQRRRRSPRRLPYGVFDDSAEAAGHLVRLPGAVILVDGYNASMSLWPDEPVAEQRHRLMDALAELVSRTGADVRVVFDGSDGADPRVSSPRSPVRVAFSPPGVEADDVIIELVGSLPPEVPVVVASDDQRVREGARRRGANLLSTGQLASALRREA